MRNDEQVTNLKINWLFVLFWVFVFSICSYDFLVVNKNIVGGAIVKISVNSGRGSHANILLSNGNHYEVEPSSIIDNLHAGDVVRVLQSSIFHRTLGVMGKNYSLNTSLTANNILFFMILMVSGVGSVGGILLLMIKMLIQS